MDIILESENKNCKYYKVINNSNCYFVKQYKSVDQDIISLLVHEFYILSLLESLECPNVKYINYFQGIIAYDYIEGQTLLSLQKESVYDKLMIFKHILEQLIKIHNCNVVHGDLKPSNIIVNKQKIIIIDFANSCLIGDKVSYATLRYCSPEQKNHECLDVRSDIYSMGVILYELVTPKKIIGDINLEIKDILRVNNIPIRIINVIEKSTFVNKNKRYQTVSEMLMDLNIIIDEYKGSV